jgi:hypothetical protein
VRSDKITAVTVACLLGAMFAFSGIQTRSADGLSFKEWLGIIILAGIFGGAAGLLGYWTVRRINPGDDDE